jgi:DHA2 family methylenomycin A resistance protein-like MFS transporter
MTEEVVPTEATGQVSPGAPRSPGRLALAVGMGCVVNPLNATMIVVAFSDIAQSFGVGLTDASWLVTLYLACTAALQPVAGAIGDRFGRRRVYLAGVLAFGVASALAGFTPSLPWLIVCRCLQAVCSAMVIPNGIAILRDGVDERHRGRAVGMLGAIMGVGAAIGLPLGAVLASRAGRQAIFWVNVPIVVAGLYVGLKWIPAVRPSRPDVSPVAVIGAALLPLAIGLELAHREPWRRAGGVVLGVAALVFGAGIAIIARSRVARADFKLLATRPILGALVFIAFQQLVFFTTLLVLPTWLTTALALPHGRAGIYVGLTTMLMVLLAPPAGRLSDAVGARVPAVVGAALAAAGIVVFALSRTELSMLRAILGLLLLGAGFGLAGPSVQRAALEEAPPRAAGLAMGLFTSARYLGGIVGAALLSASFAQRSVTVDLAEGVTILRNLAIGGALPAIAAALLLRARPALAAREATDRV